MESRPEDKARNGFSSYSANRLADNNLLRRFASLIECGDDMIKMSIKDAEELLLLASERYEKCENCDYYWEHLSKHPEEHSEEPDDD